MVFLTCAVGLLAASSLFAENFKATVAPLIPHKRYGSPTMVELKDGRILLAYNEWTTLGEISDFDSAHVSAKISPDGGRTWGRSFVLKENTSVRGRMGPPSLLRLQNGEIGMVSAELQSYTDYRYFFQRSQDDGKTWSKPAPMTRESRYYVMNNHRLIQLRSGRLLAPLSYVPDVARRREYSWKSVAFISDDSGKTWREGKQFVGMPQTEIGAQEPGLVEMKDGSVMMIFRNAYERVYRAFSKDGGETWSKPEPMEQLVAPVSPATIARIPKTGDLTIVWNYSPTIRTPIAIAISSDEARTWKNFKYLESDYFSYTYAAILFLQKQDAMLVCHWVGDPALRGTVGLKIQGLDIDYLYREEHPRGSVK